MPTRLARRWIVPALLLALLATAGFAPLPQNDKPPVSADQAVFDGEIRPSLRRYCLACHSGPGSRAGVNLADFATIESVQKSQALWRNVVRHIRERSMPPTGMPQPTNPERERLILWLGEALNKADEKLIPKDPGRVLIHRLSRLEYNNTVRDLFGVMTNPADKFPADGGGGGGFDNNADTLYIPPVLMERYLAAADEILATAPAVRLFPIRPSAKLPARAAAKALVVRHGLRLFRQPLADTDVARYLRLYDRASAAGARFDEAVKVALKGMLVSPRFLFRIEIDPGTPGAHPLSEWELASRLSYFLWSSMPDDRLFTLARQGKLRATLSAEVRRMLADPKSQSLAESFAGQWLRVNTLYTTAQPDPGKFPEFTPSLREAMFKETTLFFLSLLRNDESVLKLIDADYTFLNEELAKIYGIDGVTGTNLRPVALTDRRRGGVLTMASVLTLTSYPQRTSPVLRGKWILSEMLGTPPPPPPPVVATLSTNDAPEKGLTFRQRLEKHRTNPACASCHARIDPVGFALENFDVLGRWREQIGGVPVDATGEATDGARFAGPAQLKTYLLTKKEDFVRNLTEKLLAYALGRGLEPTDLPAVRKITQAAAARGYRGSTLIEEIAKSYPFQFRMAEPPAKSATMRAWSQGPSHAQNENRTGASRRAFSPRDSRWRSQPGSINPSPRPRA